MNKQRLDYTKVGKGAAQAMYGLEQYLATSSIEKGLLELVRFRVSQINGCAYCLDMHSKDLRHEGETEQRIYLLSAWRESRFYSERERIALDWAEKVTRLGEEGLPDELYENAQRHFNESELVDLTLAVVAINGWNSLNIAFRTDEGNYQPEKSFASDN